MMFSTKAEYGVRVMVELARRAGDGPVPLAEIAADDGLPLAYLEHLVARLRKAGLLDSRRGAHGGYLLARAPAEIAMAEVVEALEGSIAPIECISEGADGSIVCSRESMGEAASAQVCPTKLLWTRVRFSIVRTLQETTLADLVAGPRLGAAEALGPDADALGPSMKPLAPGAEALGEDGDVLGTPGGAIAPLEPERAALEQRLAAGA
jgi:Rrf2 family transcriptional regulator, cysteine metabolism repressor